MIDFRYHLVSLVSVFLALAIGVVLGAGPLRESIGATLTDQVDELRQDRADLQQAVANREAELAQRDAFLQAAAPQLLAGRLGATSVVLVALPGVEDTAVDALAEELRAAGASITGRVALQPAWVDPDQQTFRSTLAGQLAPYLDPPPAADASTEVQLATALAQSVLLPASAAETEVPESPALESLRSGELVALDGEPAERAVAAVVVAPAPADAAAATAAPDGGGSVQDWAPLLSALDEQGAGTVLAAPVSAATGDGVLAQLREAGVPEGVSTVDAVLTPPGRLTTVLALREQLDGGSGQYGVTDGADAVIPAQAEPGP